MEPSGAEPVRASPGAEPQPVRDELLRHLDAAYNLARWLCRNPDDAQDVVQESFLRAVRYGGQRPTESARAWLLQIVRNTCHTWLARNRTKVAPAEALDEAAAPESAAPDLTAERRQDAAAVRGAIALLPDEFREVIVLREIEGLAYKEIAAIVSVPVGTVMSRLSRARERLKELLAGYCAGVSDGL
jgi:RNA polymerase sigma-70 factor (ECF subfamily)